jgi:hypothetical protein
MIRKLRSLDHTLDADPSIEATARLRVLGGVLGEVARDAGSVPVAGVAACCDRSRVDLATPADHEFTSTGSRHRDRYARRGTGDGLR